MKRGDGLAIFQKTALCCGGLSVCGLLCTLFRGATDTHGGHLGGFCIATTWRPNGGTPRVSASSWRVGTAPRQRRLRRNGVRLDPCGGPLDPIGDVRRHRCPPVDPLGHARLGIAERGSKLSPAPSERGEAGQQASGGHFLPSAVRARVSSWLHSRKCLSMTARAAGSILEPVRAL